MTVSWMVEVLGWILERMAWNPQAIQAMAIRLFEVFRGSWKSQTVDQSQNQIWTVLFPTQARRICSRSTTRPHLLHIFWSQAKVMEPCTIKSQFPSTLFKVDNYRLFQVQSLQLWQFDLLKWEYCVVLDLCVKSPVYANIESQKEYFWL